MQHLPIDEQQLCARIFDRLVTGIGSKIAYPTSALAADEVSGPDVDQAMLQHVLQKLTPKESRILRPVMTNGLSGFELFHDVLGLPVLEWKRSFQAEERRKEELAKADARRREALAKAEEQKREELAKAERQKETELAAAEAYRQKERVFRTRIAALIFATLSILAGSAFFYADKKRVEASAELIKANEAAELAEQRKGLAERALGLAHWTNFSSSSQPISQQEINALWQIVYFSPATRQAFMVPLLKSPPDNAVIATLGKRPEQISRALGLLWPLSEEGVRAFNGILSVGSQITDPESLSGWALTLSTLTTEFTPEQSSLALNPILSAMSRSLDQANRLLKNVDGSSPADKLGPNPLRDRARLNDKQGETLQRYFDTMSTLAGALETLPQTQLSPQLSEIYEAVVLLATRATPESISPSNEILEAVKARADTTQTNIAVEKILQAITDNGDVSSLRALAAAFKILTRPPAASIEITRPKLQLALDSMLLLIENNEFTEVSGVFRALADISENLEPAQALRVLNSFWARNPDLGSGRTSFEIRIGLRALSKRLDSAQAGEIVTRHILPALLASNVSSPVRGQLTAAQETFQELAPKLEQQQAQSVLESILGSYQSASDLSSRQVMARAVKALNRPLTPAQAQIVLAPVLLDLSRNSYADAATLLGLIADTLRAAPAQTALTEILKILISDQAIAGEVATQLANSAKTILGKLSPEETAAVSDQIVAALKNQASIATLTRLSPLLPALAPTMTKLQGEAVADAILKQMLATSDPMQVSPLARTLWPFSSYLTPEQTTQATRQLVETLRSAPSIAVPSLVNAFRDLPVNPTPDQAAIALDRVLTELKNAPSYPLYGNLAAFLGKVSSSLTGDRALSALHDVFVLMAGESYIRQFVRLDELAKALIGRLNQEQTRTAIEDARGYLADAGSEQNARLLTVAIAALSQSLPDDAFLATIIDTLKYPTAAGSPTATLLDALSKRFPGAPGAKGNLLAVLRWLKTLQLDAGAIARPPERPARPSGRPG